MTKYLIGAVLAILLVYGLIEAWPLIVGPTFSITSPQDFATIEGGIVSIEGKAARGATLTLNGAPILHQEDGTFSTTRSFPHGGSILTFVATDRFGRSVSATRNIFVP